MNKLSSAGPNPLGQNSSPDLARRADALYHDLKIAIEYVPLQAIKRYERNARTHSKQQIEQIAASFQAFGMVSPLVISHDGQLIAGHGRLEAAKLLKLDAVPVVRIDHLDETQKRALRLADNQLAALAGWDKNLLAVEFKDLLAIDLDFDLSFDLSVTGFAPAEIDRMVESATAQGSSDEDQTPEPDRTSPAVTQLGDVWILGQHRIICGDACEPATYSALLGDERAAMSISDAPYNLEIQGMVSKSGKHAEFPMGVGEMTPAAFTAFLTSFLSHARAASSPGAIHYAFMDWRHMREMLAAGHGAGLELKNLCVWNKASAGMGGGGYRSQHELVFMWKHSGAAHKNRVQLGKFGRNRTNVWDFPGAAGLRKELELHPTPKPVSLVAEAIRDVSDRNDLVLDCFSGSGTTIMAAARTGRRARVIELDPHYVDVAITRWQDWSGLRVVHAATGLSFIETAEHRSAQGQAAHAQPIPPVLPQVRVRQRPPAVTSL